MVILAEEAEESLRRLREAVVARAELPVEALKNLLRMTASEDPSIARLGVRSMFSGLIEWLNDSFSEAEAGYYNEIFSRIIEFYRGDPNGVEFDRLLSGFGLTNRDEVLARFSRLGRPVDSAKISAGRLRRAIFLSRVTIGADVAVTSVLIDGLRRLVPDPSRLEIVLVGSRKLLELFGGDQRIRVHEVAYERTGGLLDRLMSWREVLAAIRSETSGLEAGEYLVIDPDSRLTQLGLLPLLPAVIEEQAYRFFPSRVFTAPGCSSLGQLAAAWIGVKEARAVLGLPARHLELGREVARRLRLMGAERIATVSLGVGGNAEKSAGEEFEIGLLRRLSGRGWVILDGGISNAEREQVERVVSARRTEGMPVITADEEGGWVEDPPNLTGRHERGILRWQGGIGSLAGLIAASDRYYGYDSSGQHLAAALGVPAVTFFVSANPPVFADRWAPSGSRSRTIRQTRPAPRACLT